MSNFAVGFVVGNAVANVSNDDWRKMVDDVIKACRWIKNALRRIRYAGLPVVILSATLAEAAPTFVTPEMTYRRGLTDEQYEHLWKIGRNPRIEPAAARQWMFRSYRYGNTTNWLNIVGQTNDFAKLSYTLQDENFRLEETNTIVVAENNGLWKTNGVLAAKNIVLEQENWELTETNAVLEVDAKKAQKVEKAADKAKKKDAKNFEKWVSDTEKAKKKSSEEMAEFYDSVLELAHAYEEGN